jgi:hypothetical protein
MMMMMTTTTMIMTMIMMMTTMMMMMRATHWNIDIFNQEDWLPENILSILGAMSLQFKFLFRKH